MSDSENDYNEEKQTQPEEINNDEDVEEVEAVRGSTNPGKLTDDERRKRKRERERERRKKMKQEMEEKLNRLRELENKHKKGRPKKGKEKINKIVTKEKPNPSPPKEQKEQLPQKSVSTDQKKQENREITKELKKYESGENPYLKEFARSSAFLKASLQQFKRNKAKKSEKKKMIGDMLEEKFRGFMREYIQAQKQIEKVEKEEAIEKKSKRKAKEIDEEGDEDYINEQNYLKSNHNLYKPPTKRIRTHPLLRNGIY